MKNKRITAAYIEEQIIAHRLRLTQPRKILAQVLERASDHPSVVEIHTRAHALDKSISMATVYRTLSLLYKIGVLIRHDFNPKVPGDSRGHWRFEPSMSGDHYHLIDINSGKIIEFESAELDKIQKRIAAKYGYKLHSQKIELYGSPQKK